MADQGGVGVSTAIQAVAQEIADVQTELKGIVKSIDQEEAKPKTSQDEKRLERLSKREEQLRDKEARLREEKLILLRQSVGAGGASAGVGGAGGGGDGNEESWKFELHVSTKRYDLPQFDVKPSIDELRQQLPPQCRDLPNINLYCRKSGGVYWRLTEGSVPDAGRYILQLAAKTPPVSPEESSQREAMDVSELSRLVQEYTFGDENRGVRVDTVLRDARISDVMPERWRCSQGVRDKIPEEMTLHELGMRFPFVQRESECQKFYRSISVFVETWQKHRGVNDYKKRLLIPCIGGCSGSGKSRFVPEALQRFESQDSPIPPPWLATLQSRQLLLDFDVSLLPSASQYDVANMLLSRYAEGFKLPTFTSSSVARFLEDCAGHELTATFDLIQKFENVGIRDLVIVVRLDEINADVPRDKLVAIVSLLCSVHRVASTVCLVPVLTGTDLAKLRGVSTSSGSGFDIITLPPLNDQSGIEIVQHLFFDEGSSISAAATDFLMNGFGPPRILQVLLWACFNVARCASERGTTTPPQEKGQLLAKTVKHSQIGQFLRTAQPENFSKAFACAVEAAPRCNLIESYAKLENGVGDLLYAYSVTGIAVCLDDALPGQHTITFNDIVCNGLVSIASDEQPSPRFALSLPFIMMHILSRQNSNPILSLIKSPTFKLSPDDTEVLDLNIILSRLWAAYIVRMPQVDLGWLIPVTGVPRIEIVLPLDDNPRIFTRAELPSTGEKVTGLNMSATISALSERLGSRPFYAFVNGDKAPCADSFVVFMDVWKTQLPKDFGLTSYPTATRGAKPAVTPPTPQTTFVLAIQSKRFKSTRLTAETIEQEYFKIVQIAEKYAHVFLVIITDDCDPEAVPELLRAHVSVVSGLDLEALAGYVVSSRRQRALL